ncbi:MAG: hypothetical protein GEU75_12465 [Dehalococcoidia bacterium]|nr:hypothetical protein [Dehalococcoidia bacterium]
MSDELTMRDSIEIRARPEQIWRVLTDPELTKQFMFGCEAISDWKAGSSLEWRVASNGVVQVKGAIEKIEPPRTLHYTAFAPNSPYADEPSNYLLVTLDLVAEGDRTTLNVSQGDFATVEDGQKRYEDSAAGWKSVLPKIKQLSEAF